MYKVLIVDDEPEIRQGLRLKADWSHYGFTIAGEASNGKEALNRLANEAVDVVLTDMNMPVMDGVSFLEECQKQYPSLRLIVITGYEDFHYARSAVRYRARDYLLKPVAREDLAAAISRVKRELDDERRSRDLESVNRWRLSQYYNEMKEHYIIQLVKEEPELNGYIRERASLFELTDWPLRAVRFVTAGMHPIHPEGLPAGRTPDKLRLAFELLCRELAGSFTETALAFRDPVYPGFMHFAVLDGEPALDALTHALHSQIASFIGFEIKLGVGYPVTGFPQWKTGYRSALIAWNLQSGPGREGMQETEGGAETSEQAVKVMEQLVLRGEADAFERSAGHELSEAYLRGKPAFVKTIFQIYLMLEPLAGQAGSGLTEEELLWIRPDMVFELNTPERAKRFLTKIAERIVQIRKAGSAEKEAPLIEAACRFIEDNYMYDLNLSMLAEKFSYSATYFSELFKSKVGRTFIQYLNEIRMSQAIRLLEDTSLGLWDIAELTGFSNASYFSSRFKRVFGMSPSDYRQKKAAP